jgi:hypothetical protein
MSPLGISKPRDPFSFAPKPTQQCTQFRFLKARMAEPRYEVDQSP